MERDELFTVETSFYMAANLVEIAKAIRELF